MFRYFSGLFSKQRTVNMIIAVSILVVLAHGLGLIWLRFPAKQIAPTRPVIMEVAIIPVSAPKPKVAPPPPPPPAAAKTKPLPKKTQPKPTLKRMPVVKEQADFAIMKQILEAQTIAQNTPVTPPAPNTETTANIEPFIEADINADYAENPKPDYPSMARNMGWQGKVMLRVQVSDQGLSETVEIERSSGFDILDESAIEAIKQWRFSPAKRGEMPIASSVIVPIIFTLEDQGLS